MPDEEQHPLLVKLHERRIRHQQRGLIARAGVVALGSVLVLAGIVMSGPGVPGPGIATIILGLTFLALEFDRAERLLERTILWGEAAKERAERTSRGQRVLAGAATALVVIAAVGAAVAWDVPLLPV